MEEFTQRTSYLLGTDGVDRLARAAVAVFGIGGVGSYAVEALARAGIGRLVLIDPDRVTASNRNRQLPALVSTLGASKAQVMAARVKDINPACQVEIREDLDFHNIVISLKSSDIYKTVDAYELISKKVD
ncbi:MAG: ThiF family adenylyltransferase, partial [Negativicoccus succinicivorans]|nr:ThiF family adenylyltransferase [Negativicoccus succinicivorans]